MEAKSVAGKLTLKIKGLTLDFEGPPEALLSLAAALAREPVKGSDTVSQVKTGWEQRGTAWKPIHPGKSGSFRVVP